MNTVTVSRLKDRKDFLKAKNGARSHERAFVLQLLKRDENCGVDPGIVRFGFTVTKKVGNAVMRNRIKRRLREVVRLTEIPLSSAGHDVVLIAREAAALEPFAALQSSLLHGLTHAKPGKSRDARRNSKNAKNHPKELSVKDNIANSAHTGQNPSNGR